MVRQLGAAPGEWAITRQLQIPGNCRPKATRAPKQCFVSATRTATTQKNARKYENSIRLSHIIVTLTLYIQAIYSQIREITSSHLYAVLGN